MQKGPRNEDLAALAVDLRVQIAGIKTTSNAGFEWYPYDSLASVPRLIRLLESVDVPLLKSAGAEGVVDFGCGDGQMSFLFEKLGCRVTAVDYPVTNHNSMKGIRRLKEALESTVEVIEADIDVHMPRLGEQRGLALCFGVLYHLKNPLSTMEHIARCARYCVVSTRVASHFPEGSLMPLSQPIAYLVDENELNGDETNYWIFSKPGLDRLLKRARWEVLASFSVGDTGRSDPVDPRSDERVFCLLRSHYGLANVELVKGWHDVEGNGWRWTERTFSFSAAFNAGYAPRQVTMRVFIPPEIFRGALTLSGSVNGVALRPIRLAEPGEHLYKARFRAPGRLLQFAFELDGCRLPRPDDGRELGIIVAAVEFE